LEVGDRVDGCDGLGGGSLGAGCPQGSTGLVASRDWTEAAKAASTEAHPVSKIGITVIDALLES